MTRAPDVLRAIAARRRRRLGVVSPSAPAPASLPPLDRGEHRFLAALGRPGGSIVAEVKLGSPRLGDLRRRIDPEDLARRYARAGASALSVVVEPDHFFGSYELLSDCREVSGLPTLAKDFVVDVSQLDAAAEAGADAVLLIAAMLADEELAGYADAARQRGLAPLVETHSAQELRRLENRTWELVGINNRDLRTFEVDIGRSERLASLLPEGCLGVAESGLSSRREVERLAAAGFDAFLIGEALVTSRDPEATLRRLAGRTPEMRE